MLGNSRERFFHREDTRVNRTAQDDLANLYAKLARDLAQLGVACRGCGRCCHFDEVDHTLFASALEIAFFRARVREDGIAPAAEVRPGRCPFQENGRCRAHAMRPLGCRVYFCLEGPLPGAPQASAPPSPAREEHARALERLSAEAHGELKRIHERHGLPWRYGPFLAALARSIAPEA